MKKSVVHALASSSAAFNRFAQLSLRRLHSGVGAARHGALRQLQLSSAAALRAPASKAGSPASLAERFRTDGQLPQGSEPIHFSSSAARVCSVPVAFKARLLLLIGRANLSFKRTRSGRLRRPPRSA